MILLVDNYDSFTYNLLHYISELGEKVKVVRNDNFFIEEMPTYGPIKGIVISPGPCTPNEAGQSLFLVKRWQEKLPILGVCLGHQVIGQAYGANIIKAPEPVHGKVAQILHSNKSVFNGIPSPFKATRYHSLIIERETLPDCLEITAETEDGIIMGVKHKRFPLHGVQFHPESIASEHGHKLIKNFLDSLPESPFWEYEEHFRDY